MEIIIPRDQHELLNPTQERFVEAVQKLAPEIPEIEANLGEIQQQGEVLIDELGIHPEVFNNKANVVFFSAIAQRRGIAEASKGALSPAQYSATMEFATNAAAMLAFDRADTFAATKVLMRGEDRSYVAETRQETVIDQYKNKQVTADLQKRINEGLLDDVKSRLRKTSPDDEDPYELVVLNVANNEVFAGMRPAITAGIGTPALKAQLADAKLFADYSRGLLGKSQRFMHRMGMDVVPLAWADELNGKRYLCLTLPTAEKLAYPDEARSDKYASRDYPLDVAIFEHEYAHTQGESLMPDRYPFFGQALEEFRAEAMAGNKHGYTDVKSFFRNDASFVTGINFVQTVMEKANGGEASWLYPAIAKRIGLQSCLELALVAPQHYMKSASPMQRAVANYLGGFDGVTKSILERADPERQANFWSSIDTLAKVQQGRPELTSWRNRRRSNDNLHYVSDLIEERMNQLPDLPK